MFTGVIIKIRNPKAHANEAIAKEDTSHNAYHDLYLDVLNNEDIYINKSIYHIKF